MPTYSKSLVLFTLFAVLWFENKAHHSPYEKTQKKFKKGMTSTKTSKPTLTTTTPVKVNYKCNTGTVPSCQCDIYYYPVPKSGNCKDVFKSTTPDYHFPEEDCHKVQRTVCRVVSYCGDLIIDDQQFGTPPQTPDEFLISQNISEPFCKCDIGYKSNHYPIPKSGNCTELHGRYGRRCDKARTLCADTCYCNDFYVDPIECDPQTCNNVTEPFCKCGLEGDHYPVPESGNCMDLLKQFSTTPSYYYRFGPGCYKARTVCKCMIGSYCECDDEWV